MYRKPPSPFKALDYAAVLALLSGLGGPVSWICYALGAPMHVAGIALALSGIAVGLVFGFMAGRDFEAFMTEQRLGKENGT